MYHKRRFFWRSLYIMLWSFSLGGWALFANAAEVAGVANAQLPAGVCDSPPALLEPAHDSYLRVLRFPFHWEAVPDATQYKIWITNDPEFDPHPAEIIATVSGTSYTPPVDVNPGTTYYWKVKVVECDDTSWSTVRTFRIIFPRTTILQPVNPTFVLKGDAFTVDYKFNNEPDLSNVIKVWVKNKATQEEIVLREYEIISIRKDFYHHAIWDTSSASPGIYEVWASITSENGSYADSGADIAVMVLPRPLPGSCVIGSTELPMPLSYDQPLCCVSGYIYLNGAPITGTVAASAAITVSVAGGSITTTLKTYVLEDPPHYVMSLNRPELQVQVGQTITVEAALQGMRRTIPFVARPGGQQVDVAFSDQEADAKPVPTIRRVFPTDLRMGMDTLAAEGFGQDPDATDIISAALWYSGTQVIGSGSALTISSSSFVNPGVYWIGFKVQDNEGNWSPEMRKPIFVRQEDGSLGEPPAGSYKAVLLIYAAADNDLDPWMGKSPESNNGMLYRLLKLKVRPDVLVVVLYDTPGQQDVIYTSQKDGSWSSIVQEELRMDRMETLRDFIRAQLSTVEAEFFALHLVDHANGVVGIGQDLGSDAGGTAFLTPLELRSALDAATRDLGRKIDVIHFDGCSFGLWEDAAIAEGLAHFVVASPTAAWSVFPYEKYQALGGTATSPREYALGVAGMYAWTVDIFHLPFTVSVFDMAGFDGLNQAISNFGDRLLDYIQAGATEEERETRRQAIYAQFVGVQRYDSGGEHPVEIDAQDSYVDVRHLAELAQGLPDGDVVLAAQAVTSQLPYFLIDDRALGGVYINPEDGKHYPVDLAHAHGLGLFYPPAADPDPQSAYQRYIHNLLFEATRDSGWRRFLELGWPTDLPEPPQMDLFSFPQIIYPSLYIQYLPQLRR